MMTLLRLLPPTEVLRKARFLVRQGWTQGASWRYASDSLGRTREILYCASGALKEANGGYHSIPATDVLVRAIRTMNGGQTYHPVITSDTLRISRWNDHPDRTKQEVLDAFALAIVLAEEEAATP